MAWTSEREDLLKKLWLQGLSASQIAYMMDGFTRNAIIGKAHRLNLPKRTPSTSTRPKARRVRAQPSLARIGGSSHTSARVSSSATDIRLRTSLDLEIERSIFETEHANVQAEDRVTLMTLGSRTCKWPIGDPGSEDFHFCSRDAEGNGSYCAFHHRLAYRNVRGRQMQSSAKTEQQLLKLAAS
ncbi:GcrA cell cycle regulator [Stappia sp. F7233]|uniref:GcrA cell cycle regulator n=1 Tax=Stappia albiluteola TaxID=2758565 RepID=A0A839AGR6_9HYPH|nr:GcrA family cell cycle regulator [Stappia albiluteola]MBA5778335.1 GcrA cell cycle regulator [Stappia albiluteola]